MNGSTDMSMELLMNSDNPEKVLQTMQPFIESMMHYECALMEIETKLKVLNTEFASQYNRNPFESIRCRLKKPLSIVEKMKRKGLEISIENIEGEPDGYRRCTCDLFVPGGYLYGIRAFDKTGRYPGCMCEGLHTESKAKRIPKSASDCGDSDFLVK